MLHYTVIILHVLYRWRFWACKDWKPRGKQGFDAGEVWLETNIDYMLHLNNFRHIPNIHLNLISIQVFDEDNYHNFFG